VQDCLVAGVPDERWGQRVCALVQPRDGHTVTLDELQAHARGTLAGYKIPRTLHLVERIERHPTGKVDARWANSVLTVVNETTRPSGPAPSTEDQAPGPGTAPRGGRVVR
jgi:3-oxocholest-4-en-26-oate---CoA ligase